MQQQFKVFEKKMRPLWRDLFTRAAFGRRWRE
jgi:hypothetical protein